MHNTILAIAGLISSVLWLGLLVATQFNSVAVSLGLLVVVYATGFSTTSRLNVPRTHRR